MAPQYKHLPSLIQRAHSSRERRALPSCMGSRVSRERPGLEEKAVEGRGGEQGKEDDGEVCLAERCDPGGVPVTSCPGKLLVRPEHPDWKVHPRRPVHHGGDR